MKLQYLLFCLWINCLLLTLFSCKGQAQIQDPIPMHDTLSIQSIHLNEKRMINIWTPDVYRTDSLPLPILYMADGGINEDFPHIANTLDELIKAKKIPPFILVGIENTDRKRDLTGETSLPRDKELAPTYGGSANFLNFLLKELVPQIESQYATNQVRGLLGESLSGLFVMESFFTLPSSFKYFIAFDPSLWWNEMYLVKNAANYMFNSIGSDKVLWFASSRAKDIHLPCKTLAHHLKQANYTALSWKYENEPKLKHTNIFRKKKEAAFIWALNK